MNIEITVDEAEQMQTVLAEAMAAALRMVTYPSATDDIILRNSRVADACLSIINKIKHEQQRFGV